LVGDARLLGGGRGVDVAKDLDEIVLGSVRAVREGENADEQREERDEREEDLVGDRAGVEGAIVLSEALDDRAAAPDGAG
jgi:hypothetical protein